MNQFSTSFSLFLAVAAATSLAGSVAAQRYTGSIAAGETGHAVDYYTDVDNDGVFETILGAPFAGAPIVPFAGAIEIANHVTGTPQLVVQNTTAGEGFGLAVRRVDLNRDGIPEVLVGVPFASGGGRVEVLDGLLLAAQIATPPLSGVVTPATVLRNTLPSPAGGSASQFGFSFDVGDITMDGTPDIVVGDPGQDTVYVFDGADVFAGVTTPVQTLTGTTAGSGSAFGFSVDIGGDLDGDGIIEQSMDGDGIGDVVIGAPEANPGGLSQAGIVEIYSGLYLALSGLGFQASVAGTVQGARIGHSVSMIGDTNNNGTGDVVIGAPGLGATTPANYAGLVAVVEGTSGFPLTLSFSSNVFPGGGYGFSVQPVPSILGGSAQDYFVGEPFQGTGRLHLQDSTISGAAQLTSGPIFGGGVNRYAFALRVFDQNYLNQGQIVNQTLLIGAPGGAGSTGAADTF